MNYKKVSYTLTLTVPSDLLFSIIQLNFRLLNVRKLYIKHNLTHDPFNLYMLVSSYSIGQGAG